MVYRRVKTEFEVTELLGTNIKTVKLCVATVRVISHVIQKNASCGHLKGYLSRYTEERFV